MGNIKQQDNIVINDESSSGFMNIASEYGNAALASLPFAISRLCADMAVTQFASTVIKLMPYSVFWNSNLANSAFWGGLVKFPIFIGGYYSTLAFRSVVSTAFDKLGLDSEESKMGGIKASDIVSNAALLGLCATKATLFSDTEMSAKYLSQLIGYTAIAYGLFSQLENKGFYHIDFAPPTAAQSADFASRFEYYMNLEYQVIAHCVRATIAKTIASPAANMIGENSLVKYAVAKTTDAFGFNLFERLMDIADEDAIINYTSSALFAVALATTAIYLSSLSNNILEIAFTTAAYLIGVFGGTMIAYHGVEVYQAVKYYLNDMIYNDHQNFDIGISGIENNIRNLESELLDLHEQDIIHDYA